MQRPGSPAIGSISHEVGLYGPRLIDIGLALLRGETVPPYNYVEHRAITADRAWMMQNSIPSVPEAPKSSRTRSSASAPATKSGGKAKAAKAG
jgi:ribose transport system substrate-binding protein